MECKNYFFLACLLLTCLTQRVNAQREYVINGGFEQLLEEEKIPAVWAIKGGPCLTEAKGKLPNGNYLLVWEENSTSAYDVVLTQKMQNLAEGDNYVLSCISNIGWLNEAFIQVEGDKGLFVKKLLNPDAWSNIVDKEEYISVAEGENVTVTVSLYTVGSPDKPGPMALIDDISFLNPDEDPMPSSVIGHDRDDVKVVIVEDGIQVSNAKAVSVYSGVGICVYSSKDCGDIVNIPLETGFYVVTTDNGKVHKLVVR